MTGKLRHLIEITDEAEEPDDVDKAIREIIDAVNDPEKTQPDLDEVGKQRPKMPPIVLKESGRDRYGRHVIEGVVSQAGMKFLRRKLGTMFKLELVGEVYDTDKHRVVTYREQRVKICTVCGSPSGIDVTYCPECSEELDHVDEYWSRQVEGEESWEGLGEQPPMTGHYAGERVDTELGLRYVDYYEEVNDEEL